MEHSGLTFRETLRTDIGNKLKVILMEVGQVRWLQLGLNMATLLVLKYMYRLQSECYVWRGAGELCGDAVGRGGDESGLLAHH